MNSGLFGWELGLKLKWVLGWGLSWKLILVLDLRFRLEIGWGRTLSQRVGLRWGLKLEWDYGVQLPSAREFYSNGISVLNDVFLLGMKFVSNKNKEDSLKNFLLLNPS